MIRVHSDTFLGVSIQPHVLRAQTHKTGSISDTNVKFRLLRGPLATACQSGTSQRPFFR